MQYYLPNPLYALPTIEVQAHQHDPSRSWNAHTPLPISQRRTHIIETITAVEEPYTRKTKYAGGSEHTGEISFNRIGRVSGNRNEYNEKIPGSPSPQIGGTNSNTGRDYGGIYCQIPKCDRNQTFNQTAKAFSKAGNLKSHLLTKHREELVQMGTYQEIRHYKGEGFYEFLTHLPTKPSNYSNGLNYPYPGSFEGVYSKGTLFPTLAPPTTNYSTGTSPPASLAYPSDILTSYGTEYKYKTPQGSTSGTDIDPEFGPAMRSVSESPLGAPQPLLWGSNTTISGPFWHQRCQRPFGYKCHQSCDVCRYLPFP